MGTQVEALSKYPFLSSGRKLLEGKQSTIDYPALQAAQARAAASVAIGMGKASPDRPALLAEPELAVQQMASSRLLVCLLDSEYYAQAFARGEAKSAKFLLDKEAPKEFLEVLRDFFPSASYKEGEKQGAGEQSALHVSMVDFLSAGDALGQRSLSSGIVSLSRNESLSLFEKAVFLKLRRKLPTADAPKLFKEAAMELKNSGSLPEPSFKSDYSGKYVALPCIQWILQGVPEGRRYYASMALAIACRKDGMAREQALALMQQFVDNSSHGAQPFTMREATASLDWVYKRNPRFSCKFHREHGLGPEGAGYPCMVAMRKGAEKTK